MSSNLKKKDSCQQKATTTKLISEILKYNNSFLGNFFNSEKNEQVLISQVTIIYLALYLLSSPLYKSRPVYQSSSESLELLFDLSDKK